ncbi:MAG TPA: Na+/H+ antiporter NhaA, partial [Streptosporangiaceae bacterium]|nr:Na+/H+ antiporter NhaA [Streptosporangiaceae bacterium]
MPDPEEAPDAQEAPEAGDTRGQRFPFGTVWAPSRQTPLRRFLRTETASAAVLLAATLAALAWANIDPAGYAATWSTQLSIKVGSAGLVASLHDWVNSGLMAFFFLVAGLEARREFDMGELRDRRRLALPLLVGLGGMVVPIGIYFAFNAGRASASGWGTAMSTDTAFALGMLALVGSGVPDRVRTYLLTFAIVDDVAGIVIIALAYSGHIDVTALAAGVVILAVVVVARARRLRHGAVYLALGVGAWIAFFSSGVDPVIVGLVMGMLALAYPAARIDLEQASESFRLFREQPTPELASQARESVRMALSPNDRLQQLFHPWTSYLIVPLFALANAGIHLSASFLAHAYASPVTLGILAGYVIGKPVGTVAAAWLIARISR